MSVLRHMSAKRGRAGLGRAWARALLLLVALLVAAATYYHFGVLEGLPSSPEPATAVADAEFSDPIAQAR